MDLYALQPQPFLHIAGSKFTSFSTHGPPAVYCRLSPRIEMLSASRPVCGDCYRRGFILGTMLAGRVWQGVTLQVRLTIDVDWPSD